MADLNWKGMLQYFGIFGSVALVLILVVVSVNLGGRRKELDTWSSGTDWCPSCYVAKCPRFGGFPLLYVNMLPKEYELDQALDSVNQMGRKIGIPRIWVKAPRRYQGRRLVIPFMPAPDSYYRGGSYPTRSGEIASSPLPCHWRSQTLATMEEIWRFDPQTKAPLGRPDVQVVVCTKKIAKAFDPSAVAAYPLADSQDNIPLQELRKIYAKGRGRLYILKHEGSHPIWGNHPIWGCGLMCTTGGREYSNWELEAARRHVVAPCKASGSLALPLHKGPPSDASE